MNLPRQVATTQAQVDWLDSMRARFSLPSAGKAFRCCLNWAAQTDHCFAERPQADAEDRPCVLELAATEEQWAWLDDRASAFSLIRDCMQFAATSSTTTSTTESSAAAIFEVVRCKSGTGTGATVATSETKCKGAQEALAAGGRGGVSVADLPVRLETFFALASRTCDASELFAALHGVTSAVASTFPDSLAALLSRLDPAASCQDALIVALVGVELGRAGSSGEGPVACSLRGALALVATSAGSRGGGGDVVGNAGVGAGAGAGADAEVEAAAWTVLRRTAVTNSGMWAWASNALGVSYSPDLLVTSGVVLATAIAAYPRVSGSAAIVCVFALLICLKVLFTWRDSQRQRRVGEELAHCMGRCSSVLRRQVVVATAGRDVATKTRRNNVRNGDGVLGSGGESKHDGVDKRATGTGATHDLAHVDGDSRRLAASGGTHSKEVDALLDQLNVPRGLALGALGESKGGVGGAGGADGAVSAGGADGDVLGAGASPSSDSDRAEGGLDVGLPADLLDNMRKVDAILSRDETIAAATMRTVRDNIAFLESMQEQHAGAGVDNGGTS